LIAVNSLSVILRTSGERIEFVTGYAFFLLRALDEDATTNN